MKKLGLLIWIATQKFRLMIQSFPHFSFKINILFINYLDIYKLLCNFVENFFAKKVENCGELCNFTL
jgi:hypothetical protein